MQVRLGLRLLSLWLWLSLAGTAIAQVGTERFGPDLDSPTWLTAPTGGLTRVFVTERFGDVEILDVVTGN